MSRGFGQITVIAELLKPESVFRQFMAYRESLEMEVVPHSGGPNSVGVMAQRSGRVGWSASLPTVTSARAESR